MTDPFLPGIINFLEDKYNKAVIMHEGDPYCCLVMLLSRLRRQLLASKSLKDPKKLFQFEIKIGRKPQSTKEHEGKETKSEQEEPEVIATH